MQYVDYGKTGLNISRFGLGCMRYPEDTKEAVEMVRYALDNGVNYLDTAYVYGDSEIKTGLALKNGYRDKAILATKSPIWNMTSHSDFEKYLDEQLIRLGVDCIDIYLLHNLDYTNWQTVQKYDGLSFLDKMIQKGKIKHKAFSFHGTSDAFKEVVDAYDWEMAQIQLNILDEFYQAGVEGLKYASEKGMAVVVMEPLRGGHIINDVPSIVNNLVEAYPEKRSLIEWSFRWLYNMPEATVIISGTNNLTQLKQNIEFFNNAQSGCMSQSDINFITNIREAFESNKNIGCTGCKYCMPCPKNVDIPEVFKIYNTVNIMSTHWIDKEIYKGNIVPLGRGAEECIGCGICMTHCPQGLNIPEQLKVAHEYLTK